jgi:plastocyanin
MESSHELDSSVKLNNNKAILILVAIIIVLVAASGYFLYKAHANKKNTAKMSGKSMNMAPQPTMPLTDMQKQQLASETSITTSHKTFNVTGGNFYFNPNMITVNKGDTVTIVFDDANGFHNFFLDEFEAKTKVIKTGESATVTFLADKVGTYEFYCSIGSHRQLGMKGTLVVK